MIPKVIHYCWFGENKISDEFLKYIDSWKKYCPDYEIKQWNESNYDVNKINFIKQAYDNKKYAFVSDYARVDIVNKYGGIYLDTDVELIKNLDELLKYKAYFGVEMYLNEYYVQLGIGFGSEKNNPLLEDIMKYYEKRNFIKDDGSLDCTPIPIIVNKIIKNKYSLDCIENKITYLDDFVIFPKEYFGCKDMLSNKVDTTSNSYSIHHYSATWKDKSSLTYDKLVKLFGVKLGEYIFVIFNKIRGK